MGRWRSALFVVISFSILLYFSRSTLDAFSVRDTPSYVSRSAGKRHGDPSEFGFVVGNGTYFENEVNNEGLFILNDTTGSSALIAAGSMSLSVMAVAVAAVTVVGTTARRHTSALSTVQNIIFWRLETSLKMSTRRLPTRPLRRNSRPSKIPSWI